LRTAQGLMSRNRKEIVLKSAETAGQGRVFSLTERVLRTDTGDVVDLRRQSADVLAALIDAQEEVVSKSQLIDSVWDGKAVTDDSLSQCVGDIRKVLKDDEHSILVTHPRKGYQLLRPVDQKNQRGTRLLPMVAGILVAAFALSAIWWDSQPSSEGTKTRVAILAFDDFSPEPDQEYLSDAIAEGIITELARFQQFATIARNSSFSFRGEDRDIREIAEVLDADVILEGSQQKLGERLKVTVQLIEVESGTHLWAESYDGDLSELFEFQADIIRKVASTVGGQLAVYTPRNAGRHTVTAMHLHAKGVAEMQKGGIAGPEAARPYFEAAIEADPNAAFGYIGMATYLRNATWREFDTQKRHELLNQAAGLVERALELEPNNDVAHYLMGRIHERANDLDKARIWFDKAKTLNPGLPKVYVGASIEKIYRGETKEAIEDIKYAMSIDPLYPSWFHGPLAFALWQADECGAALASLNRMPTISVGNHKRLAIYQVCVGDIGAAKSSMGVYMEVHPDATLAKEIERHGGKWTAPGQFERWLDALRIAGMPE